ncbi:MAG: PSD1 and planctomycete cytochrome C domain-containing protein [Planctomycetota bacterium]|nr:PSD1 and planctomycete cytochrome C domain-containing protein [Planctomycetota bacterium]
MAIEVSKSRDWTLATLAGLTLFAAAARGGENELFFERRVRPLLARHCYSCHGEQKQEGGLRLDSAAALAKGGDRGQVVVPGEPAKSLLISAVDRRGALKMPPARSLSKAERATLTRWISRGARWTASEFGKVPLREREGVRPSRLWSLKPVRNPSLPDVGDRSWCKTPVDRFIRSRLAAKGLTPTRRLSPAPLLRRLTLDLSGLPPTLGELNHFTQDGSPDAYARVVDRLLASPAYGERWGRHWLDVVRYCDSRDARHTGQPYDVNEAWRYRDWVVEAFNRDLPYDAFVRQQIAGDCLPMSGSQEDAARGLIATGMLVIGEWGSGDADAKKMYTDIVDDQIHVVTQAFLGVSLSCARCHDHKFDPFTTRDYYAMAGIFFSTQVATPRTDAPLMRVPLLTAVDRGVRERFEAEVAGVDRQLAELEENRRAMLRERIVGHTSRYLQAAWELEEKRLREFGQSLSSDAFATWARAKDLDPVVLTAWDRALGERVDQGTLLSVRQPDSPVANVFCWKTASVQPLFLVNSNSSEVRVPGRMAPRSVAVHPTPNQGVAVAWRSPIQGKIRLRTQIQDVHDGGNGVEWTLEKSRGIDVTTLQSGSIARGGKAIWGDGAPPIDVQVGDRLRVIVSAKGNDHICDLTRINWEIEELAQPRRTWRLARDVVDNPGQGNPHSDRHGNPAVWQFLHMARRATTQRPAFRALEPWFAAVSTLAATRVAAAANSIQERLLKPAPEDDAIRALATWLVTPGGLLGKGDQVALTAAGIAQRDVLRSKRAALQKRLAPVSMALAAREGGVPNTPHAGFQDARVHVRGDYSRLGDQVPRGVPEIIAGPDRPVIRQGSGRAELAHWITRKSHPLTSRVIVNRLWLHHFGAALVRTPGDFGNQGTPPTHPLLLDWLANRLVMTGWSIKSLHRQLVMSATYQQGAGTLAGKLDRKARQVDPDNLWWGRVASRRLEVEAIRDSLLAAAGVLDRRMGGPSAPRYPGGYSRTERKTAVFSSQRRALYLMSIRGESSDGPFVLDAADPNRVVHRRNISTTAPQALLLLNDPFIRKLAEALSRRIRGSADKNPNARVRKLYYLLYGRAPRQQEFAAARTFLAATGAGPERWVDYCHALMCTSELIYRN